MVAMRTLVETVLRDLRNQVMRWIRKYTRRLELMTEDWRELNWSDTELLREYAKANMSEGHLSSHEDSFIDKVFNELSRRRAIDEDLEELINDIQYYKVN